MRVQVLIEIHTNMIAQAIPIHFQRIWPNFSPDCTGD